MENALTLIEIQPQLNVSQHVLIDLCEREVVIPEIDTEGRGRWRKFSRKNLFEIARALELCEYEIFISVNRVITRILSSFEKAEKNSIAAACRGIWWIDRYETSICLPFKNDSLPVNRQRDLKVSRDRCLNSVGGIG